MSNYTYRAFSGGELAPELYARTDLLRYLTGLRQCRNMIIQRHGGITMRPGTKLTQEVKDSTKRARLIKFVRDATMITDTYLIELGDHYARFYQAGAPILVNNVAVWNGVTGYNVGDLVSYGGANYYCTFPNVGNLSYPPNGVYWYPLTGTIYEIPTPWAVADLPLLQTTQTGNIITFVHPNYLPQELTRLASTPNMPLGSIIWILTPVIFAPAIAPPPNVLAVGGLAGVNTYYAVTSVQQTTLEESLAALFTLVNKTPIGTSGTNGTVTCTAGAAVFSAPQLFGLNAVIQVAGSNYTVTGFTDSQHMVLSPGTPTFAASPFSIVVTLTWDQAVGATSYNVYRSTDSKTYGLISSTGGLTASTSDNTWTTNTATISTGLGSQWVPSVGQARNPLSVSTSLKAFDGNYTVNGKITLSAVGGSSYMYGRVHAYYSRGGEPRVDAGIIAASNLLVGGQGPASLVFSGTINVPDNGYSTLTIDLVPEVNGVITGGVPTFTAVADFTTPPNDNISWVTGVSGFIDSGTPANLSIAPPTEAVLFASATNYPSAVGTYQQRELYGGTIANPERLWGSRAVSRRSFSISTPLQDDDSLSLTLNGNQVNAVKAMLDLGKLVVFCSGSVLALNGNSNGVLTPAALNPQKINRQGIGNLRPLEVADSAIYVQGRGTIVRDLSPVSAGGQLGGYQGSDLTVFAAHLFDGFTIADWDYAETPHSIVWAVRSDGVLLGLTYLRESNAWGWHRHDTLGVIENICTIPEGSEDAIYVVVNRTIQGVTRRYIERFASRFFTDVRTIPFMDSAIIYNGWRTDTSTITLSGGVNWDNTELLIATASTAQFAAGDVGNSIFLVGPDGSFVRCAIAAYTSATIVSVRADRLVPVTMRGAAIGNGTSFTIGAAGFLGQWAKALLTMTGLSTLNGQAISVLADGFVVASPNNPAYPLITVLAGSITLPAPSAIILAGLPYLADTETLDLDSPGPRTDKDKKNLVNKVVLFLKQSRGIWTGLYDPTKTTAAKPTAGLAEWKPRQLESYDSPPALITDSIEIIIESNWNSNGRVFVRQVDPIPLTILSASPVGNLAT